MDRGNQRIGEFLVSMDLAWCQRCGLSNSRRCTGSGHYSRPALGCGYLFPSAFRLVGAGRSIRPHSDHEADGQIGLGPRHPWGHAFRLWTDSADFLVARHAGDFAERVVPFFIALAAAAGSSRPG